MEGKGSFMDETANQQKEINSLGYELIILNAIAQALNREVDLDRALQVTLTKVTELFNLQTGWVWLLDEVTSLPYLAAALNLPPALADHPRRMEGRCYCLDTFQAGDLDGAANVNIITCSRLQWLEKGTRGLKYHASIPLYAHGKRLGVMNVASTDWAQLSPQDLRLLYTVGDLLSISIERTRLFARSIQIGAIEERVRLAREIHDTLAQSLAAISLHLETADALLEEKDPAHPARPAVRQALALTQSSLEEARRSVLDLRASKLENKTLVSALLDLFERSAGENGLQTHYQVSGRQKRLPSRVETGIYRMVQEILSNIIRHAHAKNVYFHFQYAKNRVLINIEDDGQGFNPADIPGERFGLIGLSERARLLGGQMKIESDPGQGTRVALDIPLIPMRKLSRPKETSSK